MEATGKRRLSPKINHYGFGIIAVALFMGIILGAQVLGLWNTSGKVDNAGNPVQITGKDPAEIKGWMLLKDIANGYNIPVSEIIAAFKLPADTPETAAIKDLEGVGENFSTTTLKTWVASRIGATPPPASTPKAGGGGDKTKP